MDNFIEKNLVSLTELSFSYPNDLSFGTKIRSEFKDIEIIRSISNDIELGYFIRKFINKELIKN